VSEERGREPNFWAEAFKNQYNLIGLVTAAGFAILSASPFPLILAAGLEMMFLPIMERLERLRRAQALEAEKKQRKQNEVGDMMRALTPSERQRYHALETLAQEIRQNYRILDPSSRILLEELSGKLDFLLNFYLRMRYSLVRYESYFATTDPKRMEERIEALQREMAKGPERVQAIKARTRRVLEKRLERYKKALENRHIVDAQTETVQEVLQLLRDQSFSMRDPRTITEQLDGLVSSAEETERGVRDMEDILSAEQEILLPGSLGIEDEPLPELPAERRTPERARGQVVPMPPASAPPRNKISQ
jgi:uncharacterized protein (UPF0305 family)